jgi:hypothetical protein
MLYARAIVGQRVIGTPLYLPDHDLAKFVLGDHADRWPEILRQLEREGLPRRSHLISGLRYVPAVVAFFDSREGLSSPLEEVEDGPENWGVP